MLRLTLSGVTAALLLSACATALDPAYIAMPVTAEFETPVMASVGDSADDPAIYIGEDGTGFIAATDKQAGLYIYSLEGELREFMPIGTINNVDLREGFTWQGEDHVLMVASDDETNSIALMLYNPETDAFIRPEPAIIPTGTVSPYGICLGTLSDGSFHVGVTTKAGLYEQHVLSADGDKIMASKVRSFSTGTQSEGCVFDDRTDRLYVAEEVGRLQAFGAKPTDSDEPAIIATHRDFGMRADLEGVTLYPEGEEGGYLIVSSQGNNSYGLFSLPGYEFAGRISITEGTVDAVSTTDGIDVIATPTPRFPKGFLVVQDDMDNTSPSEPRKKQNLKVIDWRSIEAALATR